MVFRIWDLFYEHAGVFSTKWYLCADNRKLIQQIKHEKKNNLDDDCIAICINYYRLWTK